MKTNFYFTVIALLLIFSCAKKGSPGGGPIDEDKPVLVITKPAYKTTNFNEKEIRFYFDEYIVLDKITEQLIISPPLKNSVQITPQSSATKKLKIKILDTLLPNTTYTFNFGNAIKDYNEGNILENFTYIFSTGKHLDSLKSTGAIVDETRNKLKKNVSVLLYDYDSTYNDSLVYKQKPKYVTKTTDSVHFQFSNIKEGKYIMLAIDEEATDYIFDPRNDKIAFLNSPITLPNDSILSENLVLFKEESLFKFKKGKEVSKGKIAFGYEGIQKNLKVNLISQVPIDYKSAEQFEQDKDTLNYWYTPREGLDSLNFLITHKEFIDTITVNLRKKKMDSLTILPTLKGSINPLDTFFLKTNNPISSIDKSKFKLLSDTLEIDYKIIKKDIRTLGLSFKQEQNKKYKFFVYANAITDLYEVSNDTLEYKFKTKDIEDYGNISLTVNNKENKSLIIELLSEKDKVLKRKYTKENNTKIDFKFLAPKTYKIRAIIDNNDNKKWDTGSFLNKIFPEEIISLDKDLQLRANWSLNEILNIDK